MLSAVMSSRRIDLMIAGILYVNKQGDCAEEASLISGP
jgi:hypothetical protein